MTEQGMSYAECVAMEIRAEAARQKVSGRVLAQHVRRPTTTVSRWLNGATPISLDDLKLLCDSLQVPTSEITARAQTAYERGEVTRIPAIATPDDQVNYVTKRYDRSRLVDIRHRSSGFGIPRPGEDHSGKRVRLARTRHTVTRLCLRVAA